MATPVRSVRRLLLGREIDHMIRTSPLNKAEGDRLSHAKVAELIETSQTRVTALINGATTISKGDLILLANGLGFDDPAYQEILQELRRDNHQRGFWTTGYRRAYSEDLRLVIDLEDHASDISASETNRIPVLAEAEAYAAAMHQGGVDEATDLTVEDFVRARMARQDVLTRETAPEYRLVLCESCLRREFGGPEVMRDQMAHLVSFSRRRNVFLQVLPFITGATRAYVPSRFVLLEVPTSGHAGPLVMAYSEEDGEIRYIDDPKAINARRSSWRNLSTNALNFDDSRKFIQEVEADWARLVPRRVL